MGVVFDFYGTLVPDILDGLFVGELDRILQKPQNARRKIIKKILAKVGRQLQPFTGGGKV